MLRTTPRPRPLDPRTEPVINNPYSPPQYYWQLNSQTVAVYDSALDGRRPSQNIPPVPGTRVKTRSQPGMLGQAWPELKLVNEIRARVLAWQQAGYPGVTDATRRLIRYWTGADAGDAPERPLYFAQLDAALTHIWLREVQPADILEQLAADNAQYNDGIERVCHKMATGAGKTLVMALLIIWQTANHLRDRDDPRFTNRFLLLTPGITVRDRLKSLTPYRPGNDYAQFELLPPGEDWEQDLAQAQVRVANYHQLEPRSVALKPSQHGQGLMDGGRYPTTAAEAQSQLESPAEIVARITGLVPQAAGRVLVLNDESHHCHRGDPDKPAVNTVWFNGLAALRDAGRLHYAADFSATPTYIAQDNPRPVEWIVSDYNLIEAMEAGLVKIPQVPTWESSGQGEPRYRDLYAETRPAADRQKFDPADAANNALLKEALQALYSDYAATDKKWRAEHRKRLQALPEGAERPPCPKPVIAVVMNRVGNANGVFQYIADNMAGQPMPLLRNAGGQGAPPATIIVHSQLAEDGGKMPAGLLKSIQELAARYRAIPAYGFSDQDRAEDILRRVLNSVGRPGEPGEHVRCVVSVDMLTEGWDTRTVTHLLGFRKFGSSLLCEQVAGRTLRRVDHDLLDNGRYPPEYAQILGIPFPRYNDAPPARGCPRCGLEPADCNCPPPFAPVTVEPRASHSRYRIDWPHILRMERNDQAQSVGVAAAAKPERECKVSLAAAGEVISEGTTGEERAVYVAAATASREHFLYRIAAQATQKIKDELADEQGDYVVQMHRIFAETLAAARQFYADGWLAGIKDTQLWPVDDRTVAQGGDWLRRNLHLGKPAPDRELAMTLIPSPRNPWRETDELNAYTTANNPELVYGPARKAQISYAHCDSSWETRVARQLDELASVDRWTRNRRLNWYIPYVSDSQPHRYYPDFVAVAALPDGLDLHIVIEVKGEEQESDRVKRRWAEQYWIPAINRSPDYGRAAGKVWAFLYLDDAALVANAANAVQAVIDQHRAV